MLRLDDFFVMAASPLSENRWMILAVLFLARMSMAFQFQSVAALSGPYRDAFGVSLSDVGFLIGLYFIPGIFIALPGGAMGRFFGDKKTVTAGMMLMVAGAIMTGFTQDHFPAHPRWDAPIGSSSQSPREPVRALPWPDF